MMCLKKINLALVLTLSFFSSVANSAFLSGVQIKNAIYDVTFVSSVAVTGHTWATYDEVLPEITFTTLPDAKAAVDAINLAWEDTGTVFVYQLVMSDTETTYTYLTGFPYRDNDGPFGPYTRDRNVAVNSDVNYATFELVSTSPVPVPATVWLFWSGLLGMIGIARHKNA